MTPLSDTPVAPSPSVTVAPLFEQKSSSPSGRRRLTAPRARPEMMLGSLLETWQRKRKPSPKSIVAATKAVSDFISYIGDIGIGEITSEDCFEFRDAIEQMPRCMPRAHRILPFAEAHAVYADLGDFARRSPQSVKKYLGAIQALLNFAFQERYIPTNPGNGIRVEGYSRLGCRRPFTKEELRHLYAAPLFTSPWSTRQSRSKVSDETLRWLFLLGLLTGARIEELGQILLSDIRDELGTPYIAITDYGTAGPERAEKRLKTASSVRVLPLHPQLLKLGLLAHVAGLRARLETRLFPDLEIDVLCVRTEEASRRAGRLIDAAVGKDPQVVFHSLRHNYKDFCRDADIPKDVHDQLTGHAPHDTGSSYGLGRAISSLHRHTRKIVLPFIDWRSIEAASQE